MITRNLYTVGAVLAMALLVVGCNNNGSGTAPVSTNSMSGSTTTNEVVNNNPPPGITNAPMSTNDISTNLPPHTGN